MKKLSLPAVGSRPDGAHGDSEILIGESITTLARYAGAGRIVVITDKIVGKLIRGKLGPMLVIEIDAGEGAKTLETVAQIYGRLLELEIDRGSCIVGIGGGIVCDVSGFVASTYLRGVRFGFVPTTLLAQVDASVGGKNGVNFKGYKNLIGTFNQPDFVICDFDLLATLPDEEIRNGYAEIIKHAAIGDARLFGYLEENAVSASKLEPKTLERIVFDSLSVKTKIVRKDQTEQNERMKLNFGHTIGHAFEKVAKLPHGQAIAIGMLAAARLSVKRGLLSGPEASRLEKLLSAYGLPVRPGAAIVGNSDMRTLILDAIRKDKKRRGDEVRMCLLERIGCAKIVGVKLEELDGVFDADA